jgi:hypothetical protein
VAFLRCRNIYAKRWCQCAMWWQFCNLVSIPQLGTESMNGGKECEERAHANHSDSDRIGPSRRPTGTVSGMAIRRDKGAMRVISIGCMPAGAQLVSCGMVITACQEQQQRAAYTLLQWRTATLLLSGGDAGWAQAMCQLLLSVATRPGANHSATMEMATMATSAPSCNHFALEEPEPIKLMCHIVT